MWRQGVGLFAFLRQAAAAVHLLPNIISVSSHPTIVRIS